MSDDDQRQAPVPLAVATVTEQHCRCPLACLLWLSPALLLHPAPGNGGPVSMPRAPLQPGNGLRRETVFWMCHPWSPGSAAWLPSKMRLRMREWTGRRCRLGGRVRRGWHLSGPVCMSRCAGSQGTIRRLELRRAARLTSEFLRSGRRIRRPRADTLPPVYPAQPSALIACRAPPLAYVSVPLLTPLPKSPAASSSARKPSIDTGGGLFGAYAAAREQRHR